MSKTKKSTKPTKKKPTNKLAPLAPKKAPAPASVVEPKPAAAPAPAPAPLVQLGPVPKKAPAPKVAKAPALSTMQLAGHKSWETRRANIAAKKAEAERVELERQAAKAAKKVAPLKKTAPAPRVVKHRKSA